MKFVDKFAHVFAGVLLICLVCPAAWSKDHNGRKPNVHFGGQRSGITVDITCPSIEISDVNGFVHIEAAGFQTQSLPGEPVLPYQDIRAAIPPEADENTVNISVVNEVCRQVVVDKKLEAGGALAASLPDRTVYSWGHGKTIVDGRDVDIYQRDAFFPAHAIEQEQGKLRNVKISSLKFFPVRYNPVTNTLKITQSIQLKISYSLTASVANSQPTTSQADEIIDNADQSSIWYTTQSLTTSAAAFETYDYIIITTEAIKSASTALDAFEDFKELQGLNVVTVTQTYLYSDLSEAGQSGGWGGGTGNTAAANIRAWLKANYLAMGAKYALLLGDPNPSSGTVPMKMCYPRSSDYDDYQEAPTDFYYAELTGTWDLDGDGLNGEYNGDIGTGGIDQLAEIYVGRIPVYNVTDMDSILQKTIGYGTATDSLDWRHKVLLPMKPSDPETNGSGLGEGIRTNFAQVNGWTSYRIYDADYGYSPELTPCSTSNVETQWKNSYGLVTWWTHGSYSTASSVFNNSQCANLDNTTPSFTCQCSCLNGQPEYSNNLGYYLLRKGAIGTVSASRVSWYLPGSWNGNGTNSSFAYRYSGKIIELSRAGDALFASKAVLGKSCSEYWMNLLVFNLYGDPAIGIDDSGTTLAVTTYVSPDGNDSFDGTSWEQAKKTLQAAIDKTSSCGGKVWVKAGTYKPSTSDRDAVFTMKKGVSIYGGFVGTETEFNQRDPVANITILSGDIGTQGDPCDNSYCIIFGANSATLDGFTITGASGKSDSQSGAVFNDGTSSTISNCIFTANSSDYSGGAVYNKNSNARINNCLFYANSAQYGGAISNFNGSATIKNCVFVGNWAQYGGAIDSIANDPTIINCTFSGNSAVYRGGAISSNRGTSLTVNNSIIWGNQAPDSPELYTTADSTAAVSYSDVAGGLAGTGNIDVDPVFIASPSAGADGLWQTEDDNYGDLRLVSITPCADKGSNSLLSTSLTDYWGNERFTDGDGDCLAVVDMGAFETATVAGKAPAPSISHDSGTYYGAIRVTITTPLTGAVIRYTTDGNDPVETSTICENSIIVSCTCTVKAKVFKTDCETSDAVSADYTILPAKADLVGWTESDRSSYQFKVCDPITRVPLSQFKWGQQVMIMYTVKNIGTRSAGQFKVEFCLSNDSAIGNSNDFPLSGSNFFSAGIPVGSYRTVCSPAITLPASAPSGYASCSTVYFAMKVDSDNAIEESNETNNYNLAVGTDKRDITVSKITLSGYIKKSSTPISGVVVTASGSAGTATTNSLGYYALKVPYNWTGTTRPSKSGYSFIASSRSYSGLKTNISSQNFAAYVMPTISGYIKTTGGTAMSGVTVTASSGAKAVTSATGYYALKVPYNWTGKLTPSKSGYYFVPSSRSYSALTASKSSQNFTVYSCPSVSGYVKTSGGTAISGVTITASSGATAVTSTTGYYALKVPYKWTGTIKPSKSGYSFIPASRSLSAVTASKSSQSFTAVKK